MSAMSFREPNQVLWRGVRPGHNGVQVNGRKTATGTTAEIYQVSAGLTLYITYLLLNVNQSAGDNYGVIEWANSAHALQQYLIFQRLDGAGHLSLAVSFHYPIEIPATHRIRVLSSHADLDAYGIMFGWEE